MDENRRDQESQDIIKLRMMVSRLHALAVTNLHTVIGLASALLQIPNLPEDARTEGREALDSIQKQIDALAELEKISETNNGR